MKTIGLSLFLCVILNFGLSAKVWVVNSNAGAPGDFKSAQAAHDAASANDTLYFVGSTTSYNSFTVSKKLTLIGPGYFLNENPNTYSTKATANFGTITINQSVEGDQTSGGYGTTLIGLDANLIIVKVNNVSIIRCKLASLGTNLTVDSTPVYGLLVKQSYWSNGMINGTFYNANILNNILVGTTVFIYNSQIKNNTFLKNYGADGSNVFINNIFADYTTITFTYNMDSNNLKNNIFGGSKTAGTDYPTGLNSIYGAYSNIIKSSGTSEEIFQLKEGSVAIGAGEDGVDCGAFGGSEPYILSGLPPIPVIYEINVPTSVNKADGLEIQIKAKVQN